MAFLANKFAQFGDVVNPFCCRNRPDCLTCMKLKLNATCVAVFVKDDSSWCLSAYQGDLPQDAAEVEFYGMLKDRVPHVLFEQPEGTILCSDKDITEMFPKVEILLGRAIIASRFKLGTYEGVRLAWRDQSQPFSRKEKEAIECGGQCPDGCRSSY